MADPYAPPLAQVLDIEQALPGAPPDAIAIRRAHISHEASIKSMGALLLFGGVLMIMVSLPIGLTFMADPSSADSPDLAFGIGAMAFLLALGGFQCWTGLNLRRLQKRARVPGMLFGVLSLLSFSFGSVVGGYLLYLLLSQKGRTILSPAYLAIVEATPGIKPRTSIITWAVLVVLILALLGLLAAIFIG